MNRVRFCTSALLLTWLCAGSSLAQPSFVVTDLGTLGGKNSRATVLNDAGQVVGAADTPENHENGYAVSHAFVWQDGKMTDLGSLPNFPVSEACDINNRGQVLVNTSGRPQRMGNSTSFISASGRAFMWQDGKQTVLPVKRWENQLVVSRLNNEGTMAGQWDTGINNKGQKISNKSYAFEKADGSYTAQSTAVLHDGDKEIRLGTLGGDYSSAHGINDIGQIVGSSHTAAKEGRAFIWTGGKMANLGVLPEFRYRSASAINNHSQVVGWFFEPVKRIQHAALWQDGKIYDLNALIPAGSGWLLVVASDINENGQIVGSGTINGVHRGFLLTPKKP